MTSEDLTFDRLRRPTLLEMVDIVSTFFRDNPNSQVDEAIPIIEANHWDIDEYRTEFNKRAKELLDGITNSEY